MGFIIAIDGPAGAGKSTTAREVAISLGYCYLDTGAMYRSIAWKSKQLGVRIDDEEGLIALAEKLEIVFSPLQPDSSQKVFADKTDVSASIRTPEVSEITSKIASVGKLREIVVARQRVLGQESEPGVVLEGRDIGTVVFPNADLKIFLTASQDERLKRRIEELEGKGTSPNPDEILKEIVDRDARDMARAVSPLRRAEDAIEIVTDGKSREEVRLQILQLVRMRS